MVVDVLGLGGSVGLYTPDDSKVTIGVNDINRHHATDYVVVLDIPTRFDSERVKWIYNARPLAFYSHLDNWKLQPNYSPIKLAPIRGEIVLDGPLIPYSNNSPFVAIAIAYKILNATRINVYGVDFKTHHKFNGKNGTPLLIECHEHYQHLIAGLQSRGVELFTTPQSFLTDFCPVMPHLR